MRIEQKTNIQNSIGRLVVSALSLFIQIGWFVFIGIKLKNYSAVINIINGIVALMISMWVFARKDTNSNFKMPWMLLVLAFPILGICLFVTFGHKYSNKASAYLNGLHKEFFSQLELNEDYVALIEKDNQAIANQFKYLCSFEGFPIYNTNDIEFYAEASDAFSEMLRVVATAKRSIYLEYFAISDREAFGQLQKVLIEKVNSGVDVRIMYDDIGSIGFLNSSFVKKMERAGIQCRTFNKVSPAFRLYMNNRDHRKIAIIDEYTVFTGGFNIADEYFNIIHPFGHWKDSGVKVTGNATNSFLAMFHEMWSAAGKESSYKVNYHKHKSNEEKCEGFVQPYCDSPMDSTFVGENVYLNMVKAAKKSVYITTPYLVISDEMERELQMASMRGIDVRIVTPGIPDKKVIFRLTRSYYHNLCKSGVKIYEYSPGFIHSKQVLVDNELACVGTINFDYRSLFLHFENGVLMYKVNAIKNIDKDFMELFRQSEEVSQTYIIPRSFGMRIVDCALKLIAPLL